MLIGRLDTTIKVKRKTLDYSGPEPVEAWITFLTCRANAKDASASESYQAQAVQASITTRFTVRWSPDAGEVKPQDRILYAGRTYNVTGCRDVGRRRWREIDAVAEDS
ncbi:phage head closure protein [Aquibaculum sediminis]|uniref:phage head closure protein n=1 Tax=Aquibaculum sediminis TaxID=3231907 RepID=UPI003453855A